MGFGARGRRHRALWSPSVCAAARAPSNLGGGGLLEQKIMDLPRPGPH